MHQCSPTPGPDSYMFGGVLSDARGFVVPHRGCWAVYMCSGTVR